MEYGIDWGMLLGLEAGQGEEGKSEVGVRV